MPPSDTRGRWLWFVARLGLTAAVLSWLAWDVDTARLSQAWRRASPGWLALAFVLKAASLWLHEVRTWLALPVPRPRLAGVVRLCLGVGLLNLVLPARAGDMAIIAGLRQRWHVPLSTATAVVAVTSFLEAAVFGLILLAVLILAGPLAGAQGTDLSQVFAVIGMAAVAATIGVAAVVLVGRGLTSRPLSSGLAGVIQRTAIDSARLLTTPSTITVNTLAAVLQVGLLVLAFAAGLPAAGIGTAKALTLGSQVLALSSLASVALPPTWGIGPAAASKLVFVAAGLSTEQALLYAATYWLIAHLPFLLMGLPCLWSLRLTEKTGRRDSGGQA